MKKFVALYMMPLAALDEAMKSGTPEQMKEMTENWNRWLKSHEGSFVDQGAPLGKNLRVTKSGSEKVRNELTAYSIVQAETQEEAAKIFADSPHLQMPEAYIEVTEWVEMGK